MGKVWAAHWSIASLGLVADLRQVDLDLPAVQVIPNRVFLVRLGVECEPVLL
jgi:hypothetical protein